MSRVRELRMEAHVSAAQLYAETGVSERTIRRLEADPEYRPSQNTADRLLTGLSRLLKREITLESLGIVIDDPQQKAHRKHVVLPREQLRQAYALLLATPGGDVPLEAIDVALWNEDRRRLLAAIEKALWKSDIPKRSPYLFSQPKEAG
jgi:DNA-binding XRE family transcriptional regulator